MEYQQTPTVAGVDRGDDISHESTVSNLYTDDYSWERSHGPFCECIDCVMM